jgi:hypothetical protein
MSLKLPCPLFTHIHFHFLLENHRSPNTATVAQTIWRAIRKLLVTRMQKLLCGLHHHAAGSHLATDHLFGSLKQHLFGCRLYSNEEVETAVRDWLGITTDAFLPRSKI